MLSRMENSLNNPFDVVVFLHPGGWTDELTSNRWHYIKFFDQFVDVVVIQPTTDSRIYGFIERDSRFSRTQVINTKSNRPIVDSPKKNAQHILIQMSGLGYQNPLYWLSTPLFWNVASFLDNGPVVFHATEDYLRLSDYNPHPIASFLRRCTLAAARESHVTLSVSQGVTNSLEASTKIKNLIQSSNGFSSEDYGDQSEVTPLNLSKGSDSIVYCGNINRRMDFQLLIQVAECYRDRSLVLVGPVHLGESEEGSWHHLLSLGNVTHLNRCTVAQMNWIYRNSATGIIPYLPDPIIVESGFPLKALEMVATGLPIVTSQMKSLNGLSPLIHVAENNSDFLRTLDKHTRLNWCGSEPQSISSIDRFSYEIEIPRVWNLIVNAIGETKQFDRKRLRVKFSISSALLDTLKMARSKGMVMVFKEIKRALLPYSSPIDQN